MYVESRSSERKGPEGTKGVFGVILAGGRSLRFGREKALVRVDGVRLIERVVGVMKPLFGRIVLVTNTPAEYAYLNLPMYGDLIRDLGPLGGIYTALTVIPGDAAFFVACDMPFLNLGLIQYMLRVRSGFDAVVPRVAGNLEPLHALYGKSCLSSIKKLIEAGEYQIFRFFHDVSVRFVEEKEIRRYDPDLRSFYNINRPQQLKGLRQEESSLRGPRDDA
jgi:molybdopterin-guanine dinucleotide biosynthesis protein A